MIPDLQGKGVLSIYSIFAVQDDTSESCAVWINLPEAQSAEQSEKAIITQHDLQCGTFCPVCVALIKPVDGSCGVSTASDTVQISMLSFTISLGMKFVITSLYLAKGKMICWKITRSHGT